MIIGKNRATAGKRAQNNANNRMPIGGRTSDKAILSQTRSITFNDINHF